MKCDDSSPESLRNLIPVNKRGYSSLSEEEKQHWHAYDYGWRRVFLNDHNRYSTVDVPIDDMGRGKFFDPVSVRAAEQMYKARRPKRAEPQITPADEAAAKGDHERAARYRAQDRARAAAIALIEGDGKLPDGRWSPASQAFVTLCAQQARENLAEFEARQQQQAAPRRQADIPSLAEQFGVRATERPA